MSRRKSLRAKTSSSSASSDARKQIDQLFRGLTKLQLPMEPDEPPEEHDDAPSLGRCPHVFVPIAKPSIGTT